MNLSDLVGNNEVLQDKWSITAPSFGIKNQLKVVGHDGKIGKRKYYILQCAVCSKDSELFGEGYFRSTKGCLQSGRIPCGCAPAPRWTKDQYYTLCQRKTNDLRHKFVGFIGKWLNHQTKVKLVCEDHGEWTSSTISSVLWKDVNCPACNIEANRKLSLKDDSVMIDSFMSTGSFATGTKFWRSDRTNNLGWFAYWNIYCPDCGEYAESKSCHLIQGSIACACSKRRQKECYITWIVDENNKPIAIKFGITNNLKRRLKEQNKLSKYSVQKGMVFTFPTVAACKKAERECKEELITSFILKSDLPDGYTETTEIFNLSKIVEIYKRNGGSLIDW